ncbi:M protein trans-acting positive regulator [Enterococcus casseliflavus]|nr:M protein trans-acting positive regulator [Enterococcus casseliflavus]
MHSLFYQLIFHVKTKRWFTFLEVLEENEQTTASNLVAHTGFGRRTIMKDIKELKDFFGETIQLIGDENGYHFSLLDPQSYYEKKQALLTEERLFLFVDQLAAGKQLENVQWGYYLDIPAGSFSRIKRRLQEILQTRYDCQLVGKTNQLTGEEASIRQFLYDFYFTLPLYPAVIADQVGQMQRKQAAMKSDQWQLDPVLFNQWLVITKLRVDQGQLLPEQPKHPSIQEALALALDRQVKVPLPAREKAALFLLALNETQFLNPLLQKEFVRVFSPTVDFSFPVRETEGLTYRLFETLVFLMEQFFQLPKVSGMEEQEPAGSSHEKLLEILITRFLAEKNRYSNTIYVSYHLRGTASLKRWIKSEVTVAFQAAGLSLVEAPLFTRPGLVRHINVTNSDWLEKRQATIELPPVPSKARIQQVLTLYLKEGGQL